jgi:hypothetical protein
VISGIDVGHPAAAKIASCNMEGCGEYIKSEFPLIDDDLYLYVKGTNCYCELPPPQKRGEKIFTFSPLKYCGCTNFKACTIFFFSTY